MCIRDRTGGKIPGFGKFDTHSDDYGKMTLSEIKENLDKNILNDTGDWIQNLRNLRTYNDTNLAITNSLKNAAQGQAQTYKIWDPLKEWMGF